MDEYKSIIENMKDETRLFSEYISSLGFSYDEVLARFAGRFLPEERKSGQYAAGGAKPTNKDGRSAGYRDGQGSDDLLLRLSIKCANDIRSVFKGMQLWRPDDDLMRDLKYIFLHKNPHIDEYLSSLFFRACLPIEKQNLIVDEVALVSKDNDLVAIQTWPQAAVFGIGNTFSGGAKPLISFDEHVREGEEKAVNSLAMLMKRRLIGNTKAPPPIFRILNEVNHIDSFGGAHQKNLATYIKNLHLAKLSMQKDSNSGSYCMPPRWKQVIVDVCVTSFMLGIQEQRYDFQASDEWLPAIKLSLKRYMKNTSLKENPLFGYAFNRVSHFMTDVFEKELASDRVKLNVSDNKGGKTPKKFSGEYVDQIMMVPYLPVLIERYFGADIAAIVLSPLWEARVAREIENNMSRKELERVVGGGGELMDAECSLGSLTVLHCDGWGDGSKKREGGSPGEPDGGLGSGQGGAPDSGQEDMQGSGQEYKQGSGKQVAAEGRPPCTLIFELTASENISSPNSINFYISRENAGDGYSIFRDNVNGTIILSKGYSISDDEWKHVCDALILSEGNTNDISGECGCWHITRNKNGIAAFLLNGNPSHLYVPRSAITAYSLRELVLSIRNKMMNDRDGLNGCNEY